MSMEKVSIIICTRNRAAQLKTGLDALKKVKVPLYSVEVIIVDNGSNDSTRSVIKSFTESSPFPTKHLNCKQPGLSRARNMGLSNCSSDWIIFTDDDCHLDENYLINFSQFIGFEEAQYGVGQILIPNQDDDLRLANLKIEETYILPPRSILAAGTIQGANMFFRKEVFDKSGTFNELMGSGTPFPCEDINMATRASLNGYTGIQTPDLIVHHHHKKKKLSAAAEKAVQGYDYGRGAYYASLLTLGQFDFWAEWHKLAVSNGTISEMYLRELHGAANYLESIRNLNSGKKELV